MRMSKVSIEVKEYIFKYWQLSKGVRKECIKPGVDKFCKQNGFNKISVSTIGRIIKALKEEGRIENRCKLSINERSGKIKELKKTVKHKERSNGFKPKEPWDLVQIDSIHLNVEGTKRYFITAIDVFGRQTCVKEYKRLNSKNAKDFIIKVQEQYPFKIRRIQTDNGLEFYKDFDEYIKRRKITHYWNYPRSPKSNAYIERFNRTLREQFIDTYEGDLTDIKTVEKDLNDYLFWYNHKRVHQGLNFKTPFNFTRHFLKIADS
jgi:transposase InsO family protein